MDTYTHVHVCLKGGNFKGEKAKTAEGDFEGNLPQDKHGEVHPMQLYTGQKLEGRSKGKVLLLTSSGQLKPFGP